MSPMTALITGASGMLGRQLVALLEGKNITPVSLGRTPAKGIDHWQLDDIKDHNVTKSIIAEIRPNFLFHLAGTSIGSSRDDMFDVNAYFGESLLNALIHANLDQFTKTIFVGSAAEYGMVDERQCPITEMIEPAPFNDYGKSKLLGTKIALSWVDESRHLAVVRPFNILGPGLSPSIALGNFFHQIYGAKEKKLVIRTGKLSTCRDFIDARDCAEIIFALSNIPESSGHVVNACTGKPTAIRDVLEYLIQKSGKDVTHQIDKTLLRTVDPKQNFGSTAKLESLTGKKKFIHWKETIDLMVRDLV